MGAAQASATLTTPLIELTVPIKFIGASILLKSTQHYDMTTFQTLCHKASYTFTGPTASINLEARVKECRIGFVKELLSQNPKCEWNDYTPSPVYTIAPLPSLNFPETDLYSEACFTLF